MTRKKRPSVDYKSLLDVRFHSSDLDKDVSVREYFLNLMMQLWEEGEGFSGKHPFGNSGWETDLVVPLVLAGFLEGEIDEYEDDDGDVYYECDEWDDSYDDLVRSALQWWMENPYG